ncbi:predicted protein [Aspergillus nidulans FGSC A4]|uniref:Uncharacterized protein n=1 Tax=Emericella nidulans (strain FGSC A4 / ATCC 38163 / CBS 112.46 / NRRL 194 / M139) TaxID=227321 RepID=Q5BBX0_EMENI|nr:hypothetical protein [Aspergillus nidulans FGSC A4]EAA65125.1 predicted protein [Aspergillus nidulans FGSC A4]CBF85899.1 TPA: conserved hypothetical protein [Aspergillus nidulans FGSC A4]|eukprot:XP_659564.1 predicted protein [Aspergillus nidulans FGSC A4]
MTTNQRHRSQPPVPEPEYDNLEIRCTWSGEYEEVSNIRISLEVKCVPNTQLQLLSLRSPGIFFEESFLERLPQTEDDTGDLDDTKTPQSPLFGFSPLVRDASRDTGLFVDGCSGCIPETLPIVEEKEQALVASGSIKNGSDARSAEVVLGNPVPSTPTTRCRSDSVASEAESFTRSRKRSASDAELPDSGSDVGDTHGVLKDISNHKMRQKSRFAPASPADRPTESLSSEHLDASHKQMESPRSPKNLGARKSGPTKTTGLTIPNENASPRNPSRSTVTEAWLMDKLVSPGKSTPKGKQPQKSSLIPKPASTGSSETLQLTSFATTAVGFHLTSRGALEDQAPATATRKAQSVKETRVRFQIPNDAPTVTERSEGQISSPATSRELGAAMERTSLISSGKTRLCYVPGNSGDSRRPGERTDVEQPEPSDQPEVEVVNGLLILRNSKRVLPATYKVTIIAARSIYYPNEQGWSDLEIPGIPRTKSGRIGVLLFLMPAQHGLEIRTTDVNRATIVEDCLIAEFVSTGNLVIPLRRCSREFCGEIGDFTVDQEIISQSIVGVATTPGQSDQSVIQMRCHAACSVRLYNRCFWSKRCIIPLCVDGGPSGFFYCDLTSQQRVTKSICITARRTKIGVSRIRVVCSPKDIDRLYLRWTIEFPGRRAAYWIPRIYPALSTSHELSQHSLRYKLLEVMNDPSYLYSRIDATEVNCDSSEIAQIYRDYEQAPDDVSEDAESILSQPAAASNASRSKWTAEMQDGLNPSHFLKRVLVGVLCLAVLRFAYVKLPDRSSRTHPSSMGHVEVLQQTEQLPSFHSLETQFKDYQKWLGNLDSKPNLNALDDDRHAASLAGGEEAKMPASDGKQNAQSVEMEVKVEERAKPSVSLRDRVDYWLGWTGPV